MYQMTQLVLSFFQTLKVSSLEKHISALPEEIKRKIYKEYFEPTILYDKYIFILYSEPSTCLQTAELKNFLPTILAKKDTLHYILFQCDVFRETYNNHKINKKKTFRLMSNGESFSAEILICLFH